MQKLYNNIKCSNNNKLAFFTVQYSFVQYLHAFNYTHSFLKIIVHISSLPSYYAETVQQQ